MSTEKAYTLREIKSKLAKQAFPFSGITELGSAQFQFLAPSSYAGLAIHTGRHIRPELHDALEISNEDRYREEDPKTELFIKNFPIQIIARDSRFEYDINRQQDGAIYKTPDMSWGLTVWKRELTSDEISISLKKHTEFHELLDITTKYLIQNNGYGIIFDLHSYNYQREEKQAWYINEKPAINIGTIAANRAKFGQVIDDFIAKLSQIVVDGHQIRVAENEVFKGGYVARRLCSENYENLLVLAIEFKKIFMNEWTGKFYQPQFNNLIENFSSVVLELMNGVSELDEATFSQRI